MAPDQPGSDLAPEPHGRVAHRVGEPRQPVDAAPPRGVEPGDGREDGVDLLRRRRLRDDAEPRPGPLRQVLHEDREADVVVVGFDGVHRRRLQAEGREHVAVDAYLGRVHLRREVEPGEVPLQEHRGRQTGVGTRCVLQAQTETAGRAFRLVEDLDGRDRHTGVTGRQQRRDASWIDRPIEVCERLRHSNGSSDHHG